MTFRQRSSDVIDTNISGAFLGIKHVSKYMIAHKIKRENYIDFFELRMAAVSGIRRISSLHCFKGWC